ncbi:MAG: hypothetical protein QOJ99_2202 [Bryobacterales bacterium]|jgi:hypothetical protein|nr:hypothetical protein [Bryobacterales bacterium]
MFQNAFHKNLPKAALAGGIVATVLLTGCGTSTSGSTGSKHQTMTGVSETGYPGGQAKDAQSPALASSSEQAYSDAGKPKVPKEEKVEKPVAK